MKVEPQDQHRWLHRLIGTWTYEGECPGEPGQSPARFEGTEIVRALGEAWVVAEGQGQMPGGGVAETLMTLGYDPASGRFVGTWIGSMMTHLWVYDGALDAAGRVLTLEAEGPSMAGDGTMATYRDVIEFKDDDHRVLTAHVLGDDGTWQQFMTSNYRRTT
jgi:hypothetical protein